MHQLFVFLLILNLFACHKLSLPLFTANSNQQELVKLHRRSVVKIYVESQPPSFVQPWQYEEVGRGSGTGFYIGDRQIMTNAHVVAHAVSIYVQKDGDSRLIPAKVLFLGHDADLATITVEDKNFFDDMPALTFGDVPELQEAVTTIGYPRGGEQISMTEGVVSRIGFRRYVHDGSSEHLLIQVDSAINPGNSGGPVLRDDKVVGVAFQAFTSAENTGYIIPIPVVKRFLQDIADGRYNGHPLSGLVVDPQALENPQMRSYFFGDQPSRGVLVTAIKSFSPYREFLKAGDIVLSSDGYEIGVDGKVEFYRERVNFQAIADLKQQSEDIRLKVLRSGKELELKIPLLSKNLGYRTNILHSDRAEFFIHGGLVFSALSKNYLEGWGNKWYRDAPSHLRYTHYYGSLSEVFEGTEDIIILSDILMHPVNQHADDFKEQLLLSVSGVPITSLKQLKNLLEESSETLVARFYQETRPLVLNGSRLAQSHQDIIEQYQIYPESHFNE